MSRREEIRMSPEEITALLSTELEAQVATIGPTGRPHLVPVFYVVRGNGAGTGIATWTYAKSQKVVNLQRLPQATVLVAAGRSYEELRGVSMECDVEIVDDLEQITAIGHELTHRMTGNEEVATAATQFVRAQAQKRVGLLFRPTRVVSWDHAKLGGGY